MFSLRNNPTGLPMSLVKTEDDQSYAQSYDTHRSRDGESSVLLPGLQIQGTSLLLTAI
jgi:hypothetical protein